MVDGVVLSFARRNIFAATGDSCYVIQSKEASIRKYGLRCKYGFHVERLLQVVISS
jgi:hypothetical protein